MWYLVEVISGVAEQDAAVPHEAGSVAVLWRDGGSSTDTSLCRGHASRCCFYNEGRSEQDSNLWVELRGRRHQLHCRPNWHHRNYLRVRGHRRGGVVTLNGAQIGTTGDGMREGGCCLLIQLWRREEICCVRYRALDGNVKLRPHKSQLYVHNMYCVKVSNTIVFVAQWQLCCLVTNRSLVRIFTALQFFFNLFSFNYLYFFSRRGSRVFSKVFIFKNVYVLQFMWVGVFSKCFILKLFLFSIQVRVFCKKFISKLFLSFLHCLVGVFSKFLILKLFLFSWFDYHFSYFYITNYS